MDRGGVPRGLFIIKSMKEKMGVWWAMWWVVGVVRVDVCCCGGGEEVWNEEEDNHFFSSGQANIVCGEGWWKGSNGTPVRVIVNKVFSSRGFFLFCFFCNKNNMCSKEWQASQGMLIVLFLKEWLKKRGPTGQQQFLPKKEELFFLQHKFLHCCWWYCCWQNYAPCIGSCICSPPINSISPFDFIYC